MSLRRVMAELHTLSDGELDGIFELVGELIEQRRKDALDKSVGPVAEITGPGLFRSYLLRSRKSRPPSGFQSVGVMVGTGRNEIHAVVWPAGNVEAETIQLACELTPLPADLRLRLQMSPPTCGRCIGSCKEVTAWQVVYEEDDE